MVTALNTLIRCCAKALVPLFGKLRIGDCARNPDMTNYAQDG
jgi:hypothetical protein